MLALYHDLASTCSKKVRMCLFEKNLAFDSHVLNLQKFEQHDPDYLKLNPKGVVPPLIDAGAAICDSSRIIEYLDDNFAAPALRPPDADGLARMRKWIDWSDEVGYAAVYIPTWNVLSRPVVRQLDDDGLARVLGRIPTDERRERWRAVAREGFSAAEFEDAEAKMMATLAEIERELSAGPWLAGAIFSLADIAMIPFVERSFDLRDDLKDGAAYPRLLDWFARMEARPSFNKSFFFGGIDTRTRAIRQAQIEAGLVRG